MQKNCHGRKIWLVEVAFLFTRQYSPVCIRASSTGPLCVYAEYKFCSRSLNFVKQLGSFEDKGDKWNAFLLIYCHLQITEGLRTKWCVRYKPCLNCNVLPIQRSGQLPRYQWFGLKFLPVCNGCSSDDLFDEQFSCLYPSRFQTILLFLLQMVLRSQCNIDKRY